MAAADFLDLGSAEDEARSFSWREQFIQTFLERDIPLLGIRVPASTMYRFWTMLSHYHGQILNYQELSRSFGISDGAVRHYLEILEGTFMIRLLKPWFENTASDSSRRQSSICATVASSTPAGAVGFPVACFHPQARASWEGFIIEELIGLSGLRPEAFSFYRTHAGAETDLVWSSEGRRLGAEVKYADAPRMTASMRHTIEDCRLDSLFVVYPGATGYALAANVRVVPAIEMASIFHPVTAS